VREDPLISGGLIKAALVVLVAGALGVGGYLLASGADIDLPDLPDVGTTGTEGVTNLEDTTLQDTTIGDDLPPETGGPDPFSSEGLQAALVKVGDEAGADRELTRLVINETQTQFIVRQGDGIEAYSVRDTGEVEHQDASVTISGNATLADFAFPLDAVQPSAVNRMLATAKRESGADDFRPTVLTLERQIPFGSKRLAWTINAKGGGRNLTYRAAPDGSKVESAG
jgi:hypothetical protein